MTERKLGGNEARDREEAWVGTRLVTERKLGWERG